MGRRLPWTHQISTSTPRYEATTETKSAETGAHHVEVESTKSAVANDAHWPGTPHRIRKRVHSRTPSTSPPPGPPPISPLREGYDNDDLYIMVEDEFFSVAQSYTAHLHHAEYKRLMRKAKEAPPREVADLSPSKPRNVRDRARRDVLHRRQRSALDAMASRVDHDSEDDEYDISSNINGTSGRGNSLTGLLTSGGQSKTSLIGLERLPSSTRAAMGYKRASHNTDLDLHQPQRDISGVKRSPYRARDLSDTTTANQRRTLGRHRYNDNMIMEDPLALEDDEEDVWRQGRKRRTEHAGPQRGAKSIRQQPSTEHDASKLPNQQRNHIAADARATRHQNPMKQTLIDELEEGLDNEVHEILSAPSSPPPASAPSLSSSPPPQAGYRSNQARKVQSKSEQKRAQNDKDEKRDKKSRLDEVPFFMFR